MAEKIRLKISPSVARFVRPGVAAEVRLSGIRSAGALEPFERITLLFCLTKDSESAVKSAADAALAALSDDTVLVYIKSPDVHPSVLETLAGVFSVRRTIVEALLKHELVSPQTRDMLQGQLSLLADVATPSSVPLVSDSTSATPDVYEPAMDETDQPPESEDDATSEETIDEIDEEDEQYLSKYKIAQIMGIAEKIKMALSGDKEWRAILVKDSNKLVSGSVLKNPRITDGEILRILKLGVQSDEIIRLICANREWVKIYPIRKALIDCPKTPLANSLRYLGLLNEKDLARYAKSRNVSSVISTQAKRMVLAKQKKR
jgi:hypothetical protein